MIVITNETAMQALRDVVAEVGPDYTYPDSERDDLYHACRYVADGKASCIVGRALHKMGVPLEVLAEHELSSAEMVIRELIDDGVIESNESEWATQYAFAQIAQDQRKTWGKALQEAEGFSA